MRLFGDRFELNRLVRMLSTHLGPQLAAAIGVLGPVVGWTFIFTYFKLTWALALMVGYGLKRAEIQLSSAAFQENALKIQKMLNEFGASNATLPLGETTPPEAPSSFKEGK